MRLYEHEGKALLKKANIAVPASLTITNSRDIEAEDTQRKLAAMHIPLVVKAQVLSGFRAKHGAIKTYQNLQEAIATAKTFLGKTFNEETCHTVLIEEHVAAKQELFVSITYDLHTRSLCFLICSSGGTGVEEYVQQHPEMITKHLIDASERFTEEQARKITRAAGLSVADQFTQVLVSLHACFVEHDCRLIEINPLMLTAGQSFVAVDAKIILDNEAHFRHPDITYAHRVANHRTPTNREHLAIQIDKHDHRGTAGSTYYDLDGNIAILASGGGASLACMDALLGYGAKPANYTEYSGNPPAEKVTKITQVTLSKPGLCGAWVVGGTANFTDIYETMQGFIKGILSLEKKPDYPIVIRRAGPRDKEAFEMLRQFAHEHQLDIHCYGEETPMTVSAKIMAELASKYRDRRGRQR